MKVSYDLKFEKNLDLWSKAEKVKTKRNDKRAIAKGIAIQCKCIPAGC